MLFYSFGVNDEVRYGGAVRPRSSAQFVIRLEVLEDRFLLAGATGGESSVVISTPDLTAPALIGSVSPAPEAESLPVQAGNAATGMASAGSVDKSTQNESAAVPASQQQAPAAADSSDTQKNGSTAGSPEAPDAVVTGSENSGTGITYNTAASTCTGGTATGSSSAGVGSGRSSQPSSTNFQPAGSTSIPPPSSAQSVSISPPLLNPAGVPAGGIFNQLTSHSINANVSVLYIDPVASDLSASGPAAVGSSGSALSLYPGQPGSLAAQSAPNIIGFRVPRPSLLSPTDSSPRVVLVKTAVPAARERAELPDIAELALIERPVGTVSNPLESPDPESADAALVALTTSAQEVALPAPPGLPSPIDPGESDTADGHRARHRMSTNLVIYSATSLTVAASAPGLTSTIRRGKQRNNERPPVATGDPASGSRR
jgi:hypothetical protein